MTEDLLEITRELQNITKITIDTLHKLMSLEFDEDTYGTIENLESSNMFKLYVKLQSFQRKVSASPLRSDIKVKFWTTFVETVRIRDRSLDAKIVNFVLPLIANFQRDTDSPVFGVRFDNQQDIYLRDSIQEIYKTYIMHHAKNITEALSMSFILAKKITDETEREEWTMSVQGRYAFTYDIVHFI